LNSMNGSIPKDSSNPKLNHPVLNTTTNTMLAAIMPLKKN
jgi:hypothetical protein